MKGADFAEAFHRDLVGPLIAQWKPGLRYAAARLGSGSDVIGFDDETSRDHDWGCRLTVLVDEADHEVVSELDAFLERELPQSYQGRPVRFPTTWSPDHHHQVQVATVMDFAASRLGADPRDGLGDLEWLSLTGHSVLETVGGPVFHDDTMELSRLREFLAWYPAGVERFVLASAWQRLLQTLPFVGRTSDTGQEMQSRILCAQLARDLMRLAFLLERRWAPYSKWFERAFDTLANAEALRPHLEAAVSGRDWRKREDGLAAAIELLAQAQRELGLPTPEAAVASFWDRPYRTVNSELAAGSSLRLPLVGSIEQWVDNADILARPENRPAVVEAYRAWLSSNSGR